MYDMLTAGDPERLGATNLPVRSLTQQMQGYNKTGSGNHDLGVTLKAQFGEHGDVCPTIFPKLPVTIEIIAIVHEVFSGQTNEQSASLKNSVRRAVKTSPFGRGIVSSPKAVVLLRRARHSEHVPGDTGKHWTHQSEPPLKQGTPPIQVSACTNSNQIWREHTSW